MSISVTLEERILSMIEEALIIFRLVHFPQAKSFLEQTLDTQEKQVAYQNSDGKTVREVSEISGINQSAITKLWNEWYSHGLGITIDAQRGDRFVRSLSLDTFGLEVSV